MLSRERWWNAKEAIINQKAHDIYNPDSLQILLDEQYRTQVALQSLGVERSSKPSEIPGINTLVMPSGIVDLSHPLEISLIGMPRAGKSSSLEYFRKFTLSGIEVETFGERASEVKEELDRKHAFSFEAQERWETYLQQRDYAKALEMFQDGSEVDFYVAFDRDWTDIPMTRANLLYGRLDPKTGMEHSSLHALRESYNKIGDTNILIISLLVPPETSLIREGYRKSPGRTMAMPFLQVLYEQYIRLHYEMLYYRKTFGENRPFFYACLDGSGDPYSTFRMIEKTMFWLAMATTGEKQPPQFIEIY